MIENEIEKLKRLRLPKIKGTWSEILNEVAKFSTSKLFLNSNGFLIRFVGVTKHYTPYIYTEQNLGKLYFRKRNNCFMIPGDCGTYNLTDEWNYIFELVEIPFDAKIDFVKLRNTYNVLLSDRNQYTFY